MRILNVRDRVIGTGQPPLVIAEIGINHNGDLVTAKEMVDSAVQAGAEIVKFQSHVVSDEMSHHAKETIPGNSDQSIYDIMDECSLTSAEERELKAYVEDQGLIYLCTPFSRAAADHLQSLGVDAFKIGSGECNNFPLISHIADFGKPVILSTGMNDMAAVRKAVDVLEQKKTPHALLHCTNVYPTPPSLVRLGAMQEMMTAFPNTVIGLSDHTLNNAACLAAIGMGADIVERHYTDSKERPGPDISCSMTPDELSQLIQWGAEITTMRGGAKEAAVEETPTINFAFASVVTIRPVKKGEVFTKENLWVKRPGTGEFSAEQYDSLLGKTASRDLSEDYQLSRIDIES